VATQIVKIGCVKAEWPIHTMISGGVKEEWDLERLRYYLLWVKANFHPTLTQEAKDVGGLLNACHSGCQWAFLLLFSPFFLYTHGLPLAEGTRLLKWHM
jgi:hypothetical protein